MIRKRHVIICVLIVSALSTFATPSYLWYATHSIENYSGNGCNGLLSNLGTCHEDADGFDTAIVAHNINNSWRAYNRRDTACTAARWTGLSAEINDVDFLFYAGHGCGKGPLLGCTSTYGITNHSDIRFGGLGYLKWVQAAACEWFVPDSLDRCNVGLDVYTRWDSCFVGVHSVMGHRAVTYDHSYSNEMSDEFWDRWVDQGDQIYYAWQQAQIHWVYEEGGNPGLAPATAAHNQSFGYEQWSSAGDTLAPDGMGWFAYTTVGTPEY
jgi:hypothetical protein